VGVLWYNTSALLLDCTEATFAKVGLSYQQYVILMTMLSMDGLITATGLARRLVRKTNTMSTMLDRMERQGLVKRIRDLPDRRLVRVVVTQKAMEIMQQATKLGWALMERLTSVYSEEELQILAGLIEKIRERVLEELSSRNVMHEVPIQDYQKVTRLLEEMES